jgi:DtxR family Mn-dependent transcriptional regulator
MINKNQVNHTQDNDLTHSMVHYLLTIHKLKEEKGYARVTDIAKELDLTKGSVSTALGNLKKRGLVNEEEDSKFLFLSAEGHEEVHKILSSRTLLYYFLKDFLKVEESIAKKDSCLMEHLLSHETRDKFFKFMKILSCSCEEQAHDAFDFKTSLDLCQFNSPDDFLSEQKGDSHL